MATRTSAPPPEGDTPSSGFTEEQRSELRDLIAEIAGGERPPPATGPARGSSSSPRQVSDGEWDVMSDRQRESWVRQLVDFRLDELAKDDEQRRLAADVDELKKKPEPEAPPSVVTRVQRWLWGEPDR